MKTPFQELLTKGEPTISGILGVFCNEKTPEGIQRIMEEYEDWFVSNCDKSVLMGEERETARRNIGYVLGYIEPPEERNRIYRALGSVSHPVFGPTFGRT
jgi:hypothetical protein